MQQHVESALLERERTEPSRLTRPIRGPTTHVETLVLVSHPDQVERPVGVKANQETAVCGTQRSPSASASEPSGKAVQRTRAGLAGKEPVTSHPK